MRLTILPRNTQSKKEEKKKKEVEICTAIVEDFNSSF
jgi:hypothetical protein